MVRNIRCKPVKRIKRKQRFIGIKKIQSHFIITPCLCYYMLIGNAMMMASSCLCRGIVIAANRRLVKPQTFIQRDGAAALEARTSSHSVTTPRFSSSSIRCSSGIRPSPDAENRIDGNIEQRRFVQHHLCNGKRGHSVISGQQRLRYRSPPVAENTFSLHGNA